MNLTADVAVQQTDLVRFGGTSPIAGLAAGRGTRDRAIRPHSGCGNSRRIASPIRPDLFATGRD